MFKCRIYRTVVEIADLEVDLPHYTDEEMDDDRVQEHIANTITALADANEDKFIRKEPFELDWEYDD